MINKEDPPLITPADLPDDLLRRLEYDEIEVIGYFLFSQLAAQRDADTKYFRS